MVRIGIEPPGAFVEGADVACDRRVANFANAEAGRARRVDMIFGAMHMRLELESVSAGPKASPMACLSACGDAAQASPNALPVAVALLEAGAGLPQGWPENTGSPCAPMQR